MRDLIYFIDTMQFKFQKVFVIIIGTLHTSQQLCLFFFCYGITYSTEESHEEQHLLLKAAIYNWDRGIVLLGGSWMEVLHTQAI